MTSSWTVPTHFPGGQRMGREGGDRVLLGPAPLRGHNSHQAVLTASLPGCKTSAPQVAGRQLPLLVALVLYHLAGLP